MGFYINENSKGTPAPNKGKVDFLINDGAIRTKPLWQPNLVCVVQGALFDAAGYCYSEEEMKEFARDDGRQKTFLIYEHAKQLSGFDH